MFCLKNWAFYWEGVVCTVLPFKGVSCFNEGSEWFQIDLKWSRGHTDSFKINEELFRNLQRSHILQTSNWLGTLYTRYNEPALIVSFDEKQNSGNSKFFPRHTGWCRGRWWVGWIVHRIFNWGIWGKFLSPINSKLVIF